MEPVTGGQLLERIIAKDHYSEHEAASCFVQIMSAVHYLHSIGIIHRDLKPGALSQTYLAPPPRRFHASTVCFLTGLVLAENVLYASEAEDAPIKLCDFGLGRVMVEADQNAQGRERFYSRCGSPDYVAPEVLTRVGYGRECDVWSCGCILYVLLCGFAPFTETENVRKFKQIEQGQFDFPKPFWLHVSEDAKDLISQMLRVDPEQRASAEEVLSHHWVTAFRAGTSDTTAMPGLQERLASFAAARNVHRAINVCSALARMSSENRARFAPADCAGALARVAAEPELEQALRDIFRVLDRSGAGAVTEADLDHALDAVGRPACLASAAEMLRHLDVCDRGAFGFSEFCVLMTSPAVTTNGSPLVPASPAETPELKPAMWGVAEERSMPCAEWRAGTGMGISGMLSNEEIREAYEALDVTHAGVITAEDMREVLRRFGFEVTEEESEEMVRCADAKQRGHIDLEDFVSFCRAPSTPILRSPLAANEKPPPLVPRLGPSSRAVPTLDADVTTGAVLAADWRDDSLLAHAGSTGKDAAGAAQPAGSQPSWQEIPEEPCSGGLSPRVGAGQAGTGGQQCHFSLPGEKPGDGPHSEVPLASLGARNLGADLAPRAVANVLG